ncbi:MAG: hypothetical protein HC916_00710 [Coleofasciculaceae cyanobacterium SM2_1_6]|nr:hypothetical protein [Coleofasciculaceae cyanobacterium SM2_1_6]
MSLFMQRPEETSLPEVRGVDSYDTNLRIILVKSSVESVAQAFVSVKGMNVWESNVHEREIEIRRNSTFVLQLKGHAWSLIYLPYSSAEAIDPTRISTEEIEKIMYAPLEPQFDLLEADALRISALLHTFVIFYSASDTLGLTEYQIYKDGELEEKFYFQAGSSVEFQSRSRQIETRSIRSVFRFVDETIREQDAFIPSLDTRGNFNVGTRLFLQVGGLASDEIEQVDYIARQ